VKQFAHGEGLRAVVTGLCAVARAAVENGAPFDADCLDRRDPQLIATLLPGLQFLNAHYFRLRIAGLERLPREPALLVGNHNGGILGPDLAGTLGSLWENLGPDAPLYALTHDFAMRRLLPLGRLVQRLGGVRATPENAERVLRAGGKVLVYPGGDHDAFRHYRRRHEVVLGRRSGFVRVAQRVGVPIVPIVAYGAHRSALIFHEGEALARLLGLDRWSQIKRFPIALALPWGIAAGPMPYAPLPFPITIRVLPPLRVAASADPDQVREDVRKTMQSALDDLGSSS
jgi:1-acyl-sn-glycerol-3-phosphate acyltransferase